MKLLPGFHFFFISHYITFGLYLLLFSILPSEGKKELPSIKSSKQGFQSGPVPGTFTRLRSCIVPAEIIELPKISGGENHKYDGQWACRIFFIKN
jgi:hypothetical protein